MRTRDEGAVMRLRVFVRGTVQGVGFRPFIWLLAHKMGLSGFVVNGADGVTIEVEGSQEDLETFLMRVPLERPAISTIAEMRHEFLDAVGFDDFEIRESDLLGDKTASVLPDIALCPECRKEIFDPADRRYLYPFNNCTNCGPRHTIQEAVPYDRAATTMKCFAMCPECRKEYEDPSNRRYHAQPIACPACGPHIELWDARGSVLAVRHDAMLAAADALRKGHIVAVKGLGGFHLMVDARNTGAVTQLRRRKFREEKPFALMYPSLKMVREHCSLSKREEKLLVSPQSPIVILEKLRSMRFTDALPCESVSPGNPTLGVMLPYTPLHALLMNELQFPVVATSGNRKDEPIAVDEHEALERLHGIADLYLVHDRPIARHVDDSVVRVVSERLIVMRRARGYAPAPIALTDRPDAPAVLAAGAHLKSTVAVLTKSGEAVMSQHIGDLETHEALKTFRAVVDDWSTFYGRKPEMVACDLHPDYLSSVWASESGLLLFKVQHHLAHVLSCMAENHINEPVLGVAWDGTGLGTDGTVWGGEFLRVDGARWSRFAHLRTWRLPGGDSAAKEPRRSAAGMLWELFGEDAFGRLPGGTFSEEERRVLASMLTRSVNAPITSSAGRLFDAVASIIGVRQFSTYESQAAMELEWLVSRERHCRDQYPFSLEPGGNALVVDWEPMLHALLDDKSAGTSAAKMAAKFHNTLAAIIVATAQRSGIARVVLSGGCFQNASLLTKSVRRLEEVRLMPVVHKMVPPNDGGISLGQLCAVLMTIKEEQ